MSAVLRSVEARFEPFAPAHLDEVMRIEQRAYPYPWTRGNFLDTLRSGYHARLLMVGEELVGYFIAMNGVDEVHLLNITVAPEAQRQGWGRVMLDELARWARTQGKEWVWLEVRVSNARAIAVYESHGYRRVGLRKAYYPAGHGQREDAVVMSLHL